jgi:P-type Cu2+ transporter
MSLATPPDANACAPGDGAAVALTALDDPQEQAGYTRFLQDAGGRREAQSQFQLAGLYCTACAGMIESALLAVPGVRQARVNASSARAEVNWDPTLTRPSTLVAAVQAAGYDAAPDLAAPARELRIREARRGHWRLFVAGFSMMQVMMYATPTYLSVAGEIPADQLRLLQWASWLLTLPVLLFSAGPLFRGAWQSLRARRVGMDVPVVIGLVVAFVASSGATFDPGGVFGHEVYFDSVTMFVFLLLGGRSLEMRARHRAAETLEAALNRLPEVVERIDASGRSEPVSPRSLRAGDRVRVQIGQAYPADGQLLEGHSRADEALLSGESLPVAKAPGDAVVAGSLNLGAPVLMRVERVGADTRHEAIVALMREAATQRPASVRAADAVAGPFMAGVLVLALGAAVAWWFIDPSRALWVAVSVLIVTCPCALSLATPSVLLAATGALARRGVLLQRLEALEGLARIDTVVFDKTGTLTEDRIALVHAAQHADGRPVDKAQVLLQRAAALAAWSTHPASRALVAQAAAEGSDQVPVVWTSVTETAGQGLQALDAEGCNWRLGSRAWVERAGAAPAAALSAMQAPQDEHIEVWFGPADGEAVCFALNDRLRRDAEPTLGRLRAQGLNLAILSGDRPGRVAALAARLGILDAQGGARPEDKLQALAAMQARGRRVAMVGDGLNDGPVLARADVSFAFAHGSRLSQLQADAVLLSPRLGDVADARELAVKARRVIRQNLAWAAAYNAVCIPLALSGHLPPWAAGIGMAASSLFVVLNALRVGRVPVAEARVQDDRGAAPDSPANPGSALAAA